MHEAEIRIRAGVNAASAIKTCLSTVDLDMGSDMAGQVKCGDDGCLRSLWYIIEEVGVGENEGSTAWSVRLAYGFLPEPHHTIVHRDKNFSF